MTAKDAPVAPFFIVTRARGTAPPDGSVTWPVMLAVSCCAVSGTTGKSRTRTIYAAKLRNIYDLPPAAWISGYCSLYPVRLSIGRKLVSRQSRNVLFEQSRNVL